jgi:hypothetical protein
MGRIILTIGEPGSGKSRAILNLDETTTLLVKPNRKELPFKGGAVKYSTEKGNVVNCSTFPDLGNILLKVNEGTKFKTVVIEDFTHYLTNRVMNDAKITGFQKWTDLAVDVFKNLIKIEEKLREDLNVIVIGHTERNTDVNGNSVITLQTAGKLMDNQIKIPSYFTYVLHTEVVEKNGRMEYSFLTNSDGTRLAKSPEGCLDAHELNDYKLILDKIAKYQLGE